MFWIATAKLNKAYFFSHGQGHTCEMSRQRAGELVGLLFLALLGGPAEAADPITVRSGATFQFYGQLSPALLSFDDGGEKTNNFVDNTNSNSRVGVWYHRPFAWGQLNLNLETSLGFRGSNSVSQLSQDFEREWTEANIRKAEVIWETRRFGTFYLGQGSMASDGIANRDLSGTSIVSYVGIPDSAGAFFLRTQSGLLSTVAVGAAFPNFDGGRRTRVRYDTPSIRGIVVSASVGKQVQSGAFNTQDSDITLRYDRDFPAFKIAAATGYTWIGREKFSDNRTVVGSFSIEHKATGISLTSSTGTRDTTGNYRYLKLGFKTGENRIGPFSVSVDYYAANDMITNGSKSESYGIGILQKFSNPRMEAYLGLRSYAFSDPSPILYQDAYSVLFGGRWKF